MRFPEFEGEWTQTTLGEIGEIRMCKRILANQTNKEGGIPFFKIGTIGKKEDSYISETLFQEYKSKYHYPNKGQILITCAGTIGRCLIFDGNDAYYQDSNIVWIDNEESCITNPYLFYLLDSTDWSKLNTSTIVRLYNDDLRALFISLPSLEEQKKIATFLSLLDERIEAQRQIIKEHKKQKKALLHQLFSQTLRFPEFSDEWQQTTLGEVADIRRGERITKSDLIENGVYPVVSGGKEPMGYTNKYNQEGLTATIAQYGTAGYLQWQRTPFWANDVCYILKPNSPVLIPVYLYNLILEKQVDIYRLVNTTAVPAHLPKERLLSLPISLSSLEEQKKIAGLFTILDERIEIEEALLACYEAQKRYLLRQMFV